MKNLYCNRQVSSHIPTGKTKQSKTNHNPWQLAGRTTVCNAAHPSFVVFPLAEFPLLLLPCLGRHLGDDCWVSGPAHTARSSSQKNREWLQEAIVLGELVCLPHRNLSREIKTKPLSLFWSSVSERITIFLFFDFKAQPNYAYDRGSNFCCVPGCALDTLQFCRGIHINALIHLLRSPCTNNITRLNLLQAVGFVKSLPICLTY